MYNSQEVAEKIKQTAKLKKISISKMLLDCELNKNTLFTMQSNGYLPRTETLGKIADYLEVSVDYLLGRTNEKNLGSNNENSNIIESSNINNIQKSFNNNSNFPQKILTDKRTEELIETIQSLSFSNYLKVCNFVEKIKSEE